METVSLIIPVHNGGEKFRECLKSAAALNPPPLELIVVANGDTDGSRELAHGFTPQLIVISEATGPAHARNIGAQAARGDLLYFVDADVQLYPDAIACLQSAFAADPGLDALIGSYDDQPGEGDFLSQYRNLLHHYTHQTAQEEAATFWGACGAMRRAVFLRLGGFDAQRFSRPSIEDIELGYRLRASGGRIRLLRNWQVKHLKRWTWASMLRTDFYDRALPWSRLLRQHPQYMNDLNVNSRGQLSVALTGLLLLSLALCLLSPSFIFAALACMLGLLVLNASLYRFFYEARGPWFALRAIACHWLYFLYSGLAYGLTLLTTRRSAERND